MTNKQHLFTDINEFLDGQKSFREGCKLEDIKKRSHSFKIGYMMEEKLTQSRLYRKGRRDGFRI